MSLGRWLSDLKGTAQSAFQLGLGGPKVKNNSNNIAARNAADNAFVAIEALLHKTFGDDFELNSGAAGSGSDWKMTLRRPSTGMSQDLVVKMPAGNPTVGQVLYVSAFSSGVITLDYTSAGNVAPCLTVDSTALAYNSSSTVSMFTLPANAEVVLVRVIVDTAFDGTSPSMSVGISGTASKYMGATQVDLTTVGIYEVEPGVIPTGSTEALQIAFSAAGGSPTAGAARVLVTYAVPN